MKKRMFHKGMAAVLAVSLTTGGALPFMAQTVHAEDTAAEQGQIPEKKSGVVTLEKTDGSYVFGNEYLKRTFSLSADKVLSTKEITNYRTGTTPTVFTPQAGSEEFIINTLDNNSEGEDSGFVAPKKKLDTNGWTAEADSVATNEGANGGADKMFDGKILIIILNITKAQMPNGNIRIIFMSILVQRSRSSLFATSRE